MNISGSSAAKGIAVLPFGYFALTRLNSLRDYAYLIASSWLPAIWLAYRLADIGLMDAAAAFGAGYIAFISAYEIGYLINDGWDADRSDGGRQRIGFRLSWKFVLIFVGVRVGTWIAVGTLTGWIESLVWIGGFAALAAAIAQHNLVKSTGLRLASFYELATLRFLLPVVAVIPGSALPAAVIITLVLYAYPRLLSYMDGKGVLTVAERRRPGFAFLQLASLAPLLLYLTVVLELRIMAELLCYFLLVYGLWWAGSARKRSSG